MLRESHVDALVVGAGFGGLYELHKLRSIGLDAQIIEKAPELGGTWYYNQYPGAMSDTESFVYRYTWDKEDLQTYPWTHRYLHQPEILKYLNHVADRHDLRRHIRFNAEFTSADWQDDHWRVTLRSGDIITCRYFITALGQLSSAVYPDIPGIDTFEGDNVHTSAWKPGLKLAGKRVGVVGCGSTGIQVITAIASEVGQLYCFQRHPQYSVPSGNRAMTSEERAQINENYDAIIGDLRNQNTCFGFTESKTPFNEVATEKRQQVFERVWNMGNGFRFMFGGFSDLAINEEANEAACEFIRGKIAQTVKDPEKARKLQPHDLYARRPLCDSGYYQQFNRDNVDIVDLRETPINAITRTGIQTTDKHFDLDVIIFATGFDAIDGSYNRINIRGTHGRSVKDHWAEGGPKSYLGIAMAGFPNYFMIGGPHSPFTNYLPACEQHVELTASLIKRTEVTRRSDRNAVVEVLASVEDNWVALSADLVQETLFPKIKSWIFGANIAGKKVANRYYVGGMSSYEVYADEVRKTGRGFRFASPEGVKDTVNGVAKAPQEVVTDVSARPINTAGSI